MSAAKLSKIRQVNNSDYPIYLKKAKEFYATMYQAEKSENWNAVGLNGVHCVISLIDATLVKYSGLRSSDEDHSKVVDLLTSSVANRIKDVSQKAQTAKRVIAKKNTVAYENRNFFKREALDMIKQVQRFYDWAIRQL